MKKKKKKNRWKEIILPLPVSPMEKYNQFSRQFYFAQSVKSFEEANKTKPKQGDVIKLKNKWYIFM